MTQHLKTYCIALQVYHPIKEGFITCYEYLTALTLSDVWKHIQTEYPHLYYPYLKGEAVIKVNQL